MTHSMKTKEGEKAFVARAARLFIKCSTKIRFCLNSIRINYCPSIKRNNKEQLSYGAEGWLLEYQE